MRAPLITALPLALSCFTAQALTIDFGTSGRPLICTSSQDGLGATSNCGNGSYLSQSYGDIAGSVDVSYSAPRLNRASTLNWWSDAYNNLYGVAWAPNNDADSLARIEIRALQPEAVVTLTHFDLGSWPNSSRPSTVNVYAIGGGTPLFSFTGAIGQQPDNLATPFTLNVSAPGGLWIEWRDSAYNNGIDNIEYTVSAVPEGATITSLLAGLGLLGWATRRRC